jgi:hypothetical protein
MKLYFFQGSVSRAPRGSRIGDWTFVNRDRPTGSARLQPGAGAAEQRKICSPGRKPWEYKDQDRQPWKGGREAKDLPPVPGFNTR